MGRRGQGQDRRPAGPALRPRLPLPGRAERRAHDRRRAARSTRSTTCRPGILTARSAPRRRLRHRPAGARRELDELEARGISTAAACVVSGERAPDHAVARGDRPAPRAASSATCRSARPAAASGLPTRTRPRGIGIRVQDLLDPKILRQKIELALAEKNVWLERVYGAEPLELEELAARYEGFAQRLRPYVADTSLLVDRALRDGRLRPARRRAGHAARPRPRHLPVRHLVRHRRRRGRGRHRHRPEPDRRDHRRRQGVRDARRRGPVPDRDRGRGPGARARPRRASSAPPPAASAAAAGSTSSRCATRCALNGITSLALTKLDVLSTFAELPVCVALPRCATARETPTSPRTRATSTTAARSSRRCRAGRSRSTR